MVVYLPTRFDFNLFFNAKALRNKQTIKHIFLPFYLFYVHSVRFNSFLRPYMHTHVSLYIYTHTHAYI